MIDLRRFAQRILDAVRELVVGARQVERAAKRFRQWGARTCDNNSFPHGFPFRISVFIWMISHRAHRGHRGVTTPLCSLWPAVANILHTPEKRCKSLSRHESAADF